MDGEEFLEQLEREGFRRWYQFGWRSPEILYRRIRNQYRPIFRTRMMWQRAHRGWSQEDAWGFHYYLTEVIAGAVTYMRDIPANGHPDGVSYERWLEILTEIAVGMDAAKKYSYDGWSEGGEEQFNLAMDHLRTYFFDLWD